MQATIWNFHIFSPHMVYEFNPLFYQQLLGTGKETGTPLHRHLPYVCLIHDRVH